MTIKRWGDYHARNNICGVLLLDKTPDILGFLSARRLWLFIALLWAFAYLPFLGARDLRQEEGRRAGPARNMVESGDFVTPRLFGETYLSKPPGYFWITAAVGSVTGGVSELSPRIPAVVAVLVGAWLMLRFAPMDLSRATRGLAALMLPTAAVLLDKGVLGEIDSLLSMLVFASLMVFYNGYRKAGASKVAIKTWILMGLLGAAMVLIKGHPGPLQVMLPIFFFLLWEKRLKVLVSIGPVLTFLISVAPFAIWVYMLQSRHSHDLVAIWSKQSGTDVAEGGTGAFFQKYYRHLLDYTGDVLTMPLPWLLWAIPCLFIRPRKMEAGVELAAQGGSLQTVQRFLICAVLAIFVPFFLWPTALGRHVLAVIYPLSMLAAVFLMRDASRPAPQWSRKLLQSLAMMLAWGPALVAIGAIVASCYLYRPALWVTIPLALFGLFVTAMMRVLFRQTEQSPQLAGISFAVAIAMLIFAGRYVGSCIFIPMKSATDDTHLVRVELQKLLAGRSGQVYTMEMFSPLTNGLFYNVQYYAGPSLKAFNGPEMLSDKPMLVLATKDKREQLRADATIVELGDTSAAGANKKSPPQVLYLFEAKRK